MINEYHKLESEGKASRLWIYVCHDNGYVYGRGFNSSHVLVSSVETENSCNGFRLMREKRGFEDRISTKKLGTSVSEVRFSDDSLSESVVKQLLLTKQSSRIQSCGGLVITGEEHEMERTNEHQNHDHPLSDLPSGSESILSNESTDNFIAGNSYSMNSLNYKSTNSNLVGSKNFSNLAPLPGSHTHPLNPKDGNFKSDGHSQLVSAVQFPKPNYNPKMNSTVSAYDAKHENGSVRIALSNNMNRENILPLGLNCNSVRTGLLPLSASCKLGGSAIPVKSKYVSTQSGTRGHRFGLSEIRNQRTCLRHQTRNHVRPWVGKFYPGLGLISNISKQRQARNRSYHKEAVARKTEDGLNAQISSCNVLYENPNPKECHVAYHHDDASTRLTGTNSKQYEVPNQTLSKNEMPLNRRDDCCDANEATTHYTGTNGQFLDVQGGIASCMDHLSLRKLSLSSSSEQVNDNEEKAEIEEDPQSDLSSNEKDCITKTTNYYSKVNDAIPLELAAFYTHLATRVLQTIKSSDLEYVKELGSGTYGSVFHGKWKGSDVAIKRIKPSCFTEGAMEQDRLVAEFWKEAHMLGQLHHPNIVALYGVVKDEPVTNLATVTEYMVNGSLKQVLRRKDRTIDRRKRLIIAMDAAFGMEYLHEKNIVHFDLKSHNFLVNMRDPQRPICKIGDLGLSKIKQNTLISGGVRGTIPWMAPELLNSKNMVTEKVDAYSFGIVMWELLTGEEPYKNMRSEEMIAGIIKGDLRPEIPNWCDPAWRSMMERCWSSDPDARPTFSQIAKELRAMAASMNIK